MVQACALCQNRMTAVLKFPKCLGFHLTKECAFLMDSTGDRRIFVLLMVLCEHFYILFIRPNL